MGLTLDELAIKHGTDKSSPYHDYCRIHEELLAPLRHEPVALLELGVANGASLRMWGDYFTQAVSGDHIGRPVGDGYGDVKLRG
jgi:hypothetical protein